MTASEQDAGRDAAGLSPPSANRLARLPPAGQSGRYLLCAGPAEPVDLLAGCRFSAAFQLVNA
jgi:hypothetical protein